MTTNKINNMNRNTTLYYNSENKISLVTLYDQNYKELTDITVVDDKIPYCHRHGYNFHACTSDFDWGFGFTKVQFIIDLFKEYGYEWIYWSGTDTLIMNHSIKLESIIDNDYHFIVSKDCHDINADSFLIRNSKEGISYLEFIMSQYEAYKGDCWLEQRVMIHNENVEPWKSYTKIVPQRTFNSYLYELYNRDPKSEPGQFKEGDFLLHLPGLSLEDRIRICKDQSKKVIK